MNISKKPLTLVHLYPQQMNIYGDWGNVLTIKRRAEWHGYPVTVIAHNPGKQFPKNADLIIGGGGQDSGQSLVQDDLLRISEDLKRYAEFKTPMLMVCGLYQLFGHFFQTKDGTRIQGIGLFDLETYGGDKRLIGNVVTSTSFGEIVGYENHSGLTVLSDRQRPFGKIISGAGNNGRDQTEGAIYKNVYGTYLHGSLLPKNPSFADALIEKAVTKKFGSFDPQFIDDTFAEKARTVARNRPR